MDPVALRRRIGMVFQHPNPFPKRIYDNVAYDLRIHDQTENIDEKVERHSSAPHSQRSKTNC